MLPRDIWKWIFSYMDAEALIKSLRVSKEWKECVEEIPEPFRRLSLGGWPEDGFYERRVPIRRTYADEKLQRWRGTWNITDCVGSVKAILNCTVYKKHLRELRIAKVSLIPKDIPEGVESIEIWDPLPLFGLNITEKVGRKITYASIHSTMDMEGYNVLDMMNTLRLREECLITADTAMSPVLFAIRNIRWEKAFLVGTWMLNEIQCKYLKKLRLDMISHSPDLFERCTSLKYLELDLGTGVPRFIYLIPAMNALPHLETLELWVSCLDVYGTTPIDVKMKHIKHLILHCYNLLVLDCPYLIAYCMKYVEPGTLESLEVSFKDVNTSYLNSQDMISALHDASVPRVYVYMNRDTHDAMLRALVHDELIPSSIYINLGQGWYPRSYYKSKRKFHDDEPTESNKRPR